MVPHVAHQGTSQMLSRTFGSSPEPRRPIGRQQCGQFVRLRFVEGEPIPLREEEGRATGMSGPWKTGACILNGGAGAWAFAGLAEQLGRALWLEVSETPRAFNYLLLVERLDPAE